MRTSIHPLPLHTGATASSMHSRRSLLHRAAEAIPSEALEAGRGQVNSLRVSVNADDGQFRVFRARPPCATQLLGWRRPGPLRSLNRRGPACQALGEKDRDVTLGGRATESERRDESAHRLRCVSVAPPSTLTRVRSVRRSPPVLPPSGKWCRNSGRRPQVRSEHPGDNFFCCWRHLLLDRRCSREPGVYFCSRSRADDGEFAIQTAHARSARTLMRPVYQELRRKPGASRGSSRPGPSGGQGLTAPRSPLEFRGGGMHRCSALVRVRTIRPACLPSGNRAGGRETCALSSSLGSYVPGDMYPPCSNFHHPTLRTIFPRGKGRRGAQCCAFLAG